MEAEKPAVLIVDDEAPNLAALERTLRGEFQVRSCLTGREALDQLRTTPFSVVLCDQRMPEISGVEVLEQALKLQPNCSRIVLTAHSQVEEILQTVNKAQVFRYLMKPWNNADLVHAVRQGTETARLRIERDRLFQDLLEKNRLLQSKETELRELNQNLEKIVEQRTLELKKANDRLSDLAMTDPLTKLLNRRALFTKLQEEVDRARRYGHPITVGMLDVDHFKSFNDMEGHLAGDEALKKIAAILTGNLRKTDAICRYGGEEFLIAMPETKLPNAQEICNRLRSAVETTEFLGQKAAAYLTISIGLAMFPQHGTSVEALIRSADEALYEAKRLGRNRVVVHS